MIKVGIIGATGYAGGELARILMGHKLSLIHILPMPTMKRVKRPSGSGKRRRQRGYSASCQKTSAGR